MCELGLNNEIAALFQLLLDDFVGILYHGCELLG